MPDIPNFSRDMGKHALYFHPDLAEFNACLFDNLYAPFVRTWRGCGIKD